MKKYFKRFALGAVTLLLPLNLQAIWQPPVIISDPINQQQLQQRGPVLDVNRDGNAVAVWIARNGQPFPNNNKIYSSFYTRGIGWSPSVQISSNADNGFNGPLYNSPFGPDVAMSRDSNYAVSVWDSEYSTDNFPQVITATVRNLSGVWEPVQILSDQSGDYFSRSANVDVNTSNLALAAWREQFTPDNTEFITISFLPFGGVWTPPFQIGGPNIVDLDDLKPYPKLNSEGDAVVSWRTKFSSGPNTFGVQVATFDSTTSTWSGSVTLDLNQTNVSDTPRSDINDNGNAVAAWATAAGEMKAAYFNGTSWETAQIIMGTDVELNSANVVIDQENVATAMWQTSLAREIFVSQSIAGGAWSVPLKISDGLSNSNPDYSFEPLAVNEAGDLIAIWSDGFGIVSSFSTNGTIWSAPERIFTGIANLESIGLADCGFAVALWNADGENAIIAAVNTNFLTPIDPLVRFKACCQVFATQKICFNTLSWSGDPCLTAYNIYRNGVLLTTVPATPPFILNDPIRKCSTTGTAIYTISAINRFGFEGIQVPFTTIP